jgi:hypothetical protein
MSEKAMSTCEFARWARLDQSDPGKPELKPFLHEGHEVHEEIQDMIKLRFSFIS